VAPPSDEQVCGDVKNSRIGSPDLTSRQFDFRLRIHLNPGAAEPPHRLLKINGHEVCMSSPALHRRWAREYLVRAQEAPHRDRKVKYLRLAVRNCVRARALESEVAQPEQIRRKGKAAAEQ
jgi:hypothetical protein